MESASGGRRSITQMAKSPAAENSTCKGSRFVSRRRANVEAIHGNAVVFQISADLEVVDRSGDEGVVERLSYHERRKRIGGMLNLQHRRAS